MDSRTTPAVERGPKSRERLGRPFWLILAGVCLVGIAVLVPNLMKARQTSCGGHTCVANLKQIDGAKEQWALEMGKTTNDLPTWNDLIGTDKFIKNTLSCPAEGKYSLNPIGQYPACSEGGQSHSLSR